MSRRGAVIGANAFLEVELRVVLLRKPGKVTRIPEPMQARHLQRDATKTCCGLPLGEAIAAGSTVLRVERDHFLPWRWLVEVEMLCYRCRAGAGRKAERELRKMARASA